MTTSALRIGEDNALIYNHFQLKTFLYLFLSCHKKNELIDLEISYFKDMLLVEVMSK